MGRYDIAIIGTGPAGISAAVTAKIRNKNILLLGSEALSDKIEKAEVIYNYPGFPKISGKELQEAFKRHLEDMDIAVTPGKANAVYAMGDFFSVQTSDNQTYEASTVILAAGVHVGKPYPGEKELLGRGVSYCATCDAPLYKGKTAAVIGFSPKEETEALFLAENAEHMFYFPMYSEEVENDGRLEVIREKPVSIEGTNKVEKLVTEEQTYPVDGVFLLRESVPPAQLIPGLRMSDRHVEVNRRMETNLPGCFACGDITGTPYQYVKAAGEGNVAALSAVSYLAGNPKDVPAR